MKADFKRTMNHTPLLSALNDKQIDGLLDAAVVKRLGRKETLFVETDPVEGFFLVLEGVMKIYKLSPDGKEYVLHLAYPGQTFAEAALFGLSAYPAGAEAVEPSVVLMIPKDHFLALVVDDRDLTLRMFQTMAIWLRRMTDIISSLAFRDVETRLIAYLRQLCLGQYQKFEDGLQVDLGVEKSLLASYLGTIPETFSRVLRKLQDKEIISVKGPTITVLDVQRMQCMLEEDWEEGADL